MALAQEHAQAGEERGRWEKELAGSEVEAQVLQMDIDALTRRLQLTSASSAAMRQLRQKLSEEDRLARQGLAADAQHILNLPDVFFNGHVHAMKAEIQALMHRLSEAQELKAEQDITLLHLGADVLEANPGLEQFQPVRLAHSIDHRGGCQRLDHPARLSAVHAVVMQ